MGLYNFEQEINKWSSESYATSIEWTERKVLRRPKVKGIWTHPGFIKVNRDDVVEQIFFTTKEIFNPELYIKTKTNKNKQKIRINKTYKNSRSKQDFKCMQMENILMISEQRICVICETPFTAKAYNKSDLRKTCCSKCAAKLTKINMNKHKPNLIKGKPLKEYIEETIKTNNLTTCRPRTIVYFNPVLRALDSHSLRSKIGRVLANDLGYTKISKKAYQKL